MKIRAPHCFGWRVALSHNDTPLRDLRRRRKPIASQEAFHLRHAASKLTLHQWWSHIVLIAAAARKSSAAMSTCMTVCLMYSGADVALSCRVLTAVMSSYMILGDSVVVNEREHAWESSKLRT